MLIQLFLIIASAARAQTADLILTGGKIWIAPGKTVSALAVHGNRVLAAGSEAEISRFQDKKTKVVNLAGRSAVPGFHDAHVHLLKGAFSLVQADLNGTTSLAQVRERLAAYAKTHPQEEWIIGRGWDHMLFEKKALPSSADLDAETSTAPVVLTHVDGHMMWVNAEALRRAHIDRQTVDPAGGKIERDLTGAPTGILDEAAMEVMKTAMPQPSRAQKLDALREALKSAREGGVTTVESLQGPIDYAPDDQLELLRELERRGELTLRALVWGRLEKPEALGAPQAHDLSTEKVSYGGLKGFVDGVIGSRTAALLAPYSDSPVSGEPKYTQEELSRLVARAHRLGFPVALHAVGDRAVRMALNACAAAKTFPGYPCRIEHIEAIDAADIPRFKALHVAASMQPSHMTYDDETQNYNPDRLGPRVARAFAWKSLQKAGATLIFGTDFPVMPLDPRIELFAATTREHFNGKPEGGWIAEQKISLEDALAHYTRDPAKVAALVDQGTLLPGKLADIAVFHEDLFKTEGLALLKIPLDMTIFDGKIVYERGF